MLLSSPNHGKLQCVIAVTYNSYLDKSHTLLRQGKPIFIGFWGCISISQIKIYLVAENIPAL